MNKLLSIYLNNKNLGDIFERELPCEKEVVFDVSKNDGLIFKDCVNEKLHVHGFGGYEGEIDLLVRVYENFACQPDCRFLSRSEFDGIRFQPFYISVASVNNKMNVGKGLMARGLHYKGYVTPKSVLLSCECDCCGKSFLIRSFHAGMNSVGYLYSESGMYTIVVDGSVPGCPHFLQEPDLPKIKELEQVLPHSPDGTLFKYLNSFKCPYCFSPYIDFEKNPRERIVEYYGNYFLGSELMYFQV